MFSCEYCEIFKDIFFIEHLQWLLLLFWNDQVLLTILVVNWQQVLILWTVKFNLEAALETNDVIESDVKELIKK